MPSVDFQHLNVVVFYNFVHFYYCFLGRRFTEFLAHLFQKFPPLTHLKCVLHLWSPYLIVIWAQKLFYSFWIKCKCLIAFIIGHLSICISCLKCICSYLSLLFLNPFHKLLLQKTLLIFCLVPLIIPFYLLNWLVFSCLSFVCLDFLKTWFQVLFFPHLILFLQETSFTTLALIDSL